jgi:aldehyde dehydrogenase (NAD+)
VQYDPLGVVLVIGPWNYPLYLSLAPLVAAVAAGNCAVVKPSELAPATSAVPAKLIPQYLDPAAIRVVEGDAAVTQALLAQGFDHALFTGGTEVGKKIMAAAAPTLTPVTLELGGKSPVIVAADADVDVAARRIAWVKLRHARQRSRPLRIAFRLGKGEKPCQQLNLAFPPRRERTRK